MLDDPDLLCGIVDKEGCGSRYIVSAFDGHIRILSVTSKQIDKLVYHFAAIIDRRLLMPWNANVEDDNPDLRNSYQIRPQPSCSSSVIFGDLSLNGARWIRYAGRAHLDTCYYSSRRWTLES